MICEIVKNYKISSPYGPRKMEPPLNFHRGIDFVSSTGSLDVLAPIGGLITWCHDRYDETQRWNLNSKSKWGNWCVIKGELDNKIYQFSIRHLNPIYVKLNDEVKMGQVLGQYSNVGYSYGAHVHLSIFTENDFEIDPTEIVKRFESYTKFLEA